MQQDIAKFFRDGGQLLVDSEASDLPDGAVVFDVGFHTGKWSKGINPKAKLFAYEASPSIFNSFATDRNVGDHVVKCYGLGGESRECDIFLGGNNGDATSIFGHGSPQTERAKIVDVAEEFANENIDSVDIMKINIEGAEYELIDRMISTGIISMVKRLIVQFHDLGESDSNNRQTIRERLADTHECFFEYPYVWEGWKLK
jgi:FkbM family methyltransferase